MCQDTLTNPLLDPCVDPISISISAVVAAAGGVIAWAAKRRNSKELGQNSVLGSWLYNHDVSRFRRTFAKAGYSKKDALRLAIEQADKMWKKSSEEPSVLPIDKKRQNKSRRPPDAPNDGRATGNPP
jgi:hypothetical protein